MARVGKDDRCRRERKAESNFYKEHAEMARGTKGSKLNDYFALLNTVLQISSEIKVYDDELNQAKQASLLEYHKILHMNSFDNIECSNNPHFEHYAGAHHDTFSFSSRKRMHTTYEDTCDGMCSRQDLRMLMNNISRFRLAHF